MSAVANKMTIGLAGSFTLDPLAKHLEKKLSGRGFENSEFSVAPYNQLQQLSLNPDTLLGGTPDYLIVLWRLEDIGLGEIDNFVNSLQMLRQNYQGTLVVSNCPYPSSPEFTAQDLKQQDTGLKTYTNALNIFTNALLEIDNIKILNLAGLMTDFGSTNAHDDRKWYLYKQPYTEKFWEVIAEQAARIIVAQKIAAKKCIVLDCDGTLWGGIVGEDSLGGIEIGQDFPGSAYTDFQKYLIHLRSRGLFLAIASKNNEEDVFEVFDTHDAMVLKRDHISSWQVHWNSKADSIQAIAEDLNIGTDSIVFVDDSPKEIAEIENRLPDVTCFLVPEEIAELPTLLSKTHLFDIADLTKEDKKRADMMMAESNRKSAHKQMSEEDFLKSLELKIDVFEAQSQHLGRITQLINKTNQFNVTTKRRTADEVKTLSNNSDIILLGMNVSDRYGDYGLVGVVILKKLDKTDWNIDSLMMSCRVLGRGAETSLIAKTAEAAAKRGAKKLIGTYLPTKKNQLVENLFPDHEFKVDGNQWVLDIINVPKAPDYVDASLEIAKEK